MFIRSRYTPDNFLKMLRNVPNTDMQTFIENHEISESSLSQSASLIIGIIRIAGEKCSKFLETKYLLDVFDKQFKTNFKFEDLIKSLDACQTSTELKFEYALKMKHLITNGSQLNTVLENFENKAYSVKYINEIEQYWKSMHKQKSRFEFMTGSVDQNAHNHLFFKTLGNDANIIAKRIFDIADIQLDSLSIKNAI